MTPKDSPPGQKVSNIQKTTINSSRQNEVAGPQWKRVQLWMCLVGKVESDAVKNCIA